MRALTWEEKRGFRLKHNKNSEQGRHHIFFDIESRLVSQGNGVKHHVYRLGWACYWRRDTDREEWRFCPTPDTLFEFIESKSFPKQKLQIWAHNAHYDFSVARLPSLLALHGWTYTTHYFAGGMGAWFFGVRKGLRHLLFLDSMNYYQQSLKSLGDLLGIAKMDVDPLTAPEADVIRYCKQDVEILKEAVKRFLRFIGDNDLGNVGRTLASTAMNCYRHKHLDKRISIHKYAPAWRLEHAAYYGGRAEVFRLGMQPGPLTLLDINSQYPSVMASTALPYELVAYSEDVNQVDTLARIMRRFFVIADITLDTDRNRYPVRLLPGECRDGATMQEDPLARWGKNGLRTVYPRGRFRTCLPHGSLSAAMQAGQVIRVHRVALYHADVLFESFVKEFWTRRQLTLANGNEVDSYLYKILLNSFYGKWGQRQSKKIAEYDCAPDAWSVEMSLLDGEPVKIERLLGKERWLQKSEIAARNAFPAISAGITDYGRELLWNCWQEAGMDEVRYSDTDSLVVTPAGKERLTARIGPELGQLKVEKVFDWFCVYGPKDYVSDKGAKQKGISKSAVYDPLEDVWRQEQWTRPHGLLREGIDAPYTSKVIMKRLRREVLVKKALTTGTLEPFSLC